jgi:hypothetical protein
MLSKKGFHGYRIRRKRKQRPTSSKTNYTEATRTTSSCYLEGIRLNEHEEMKSMMMFVIVGRPSDSDGRRREAKNVSRCPMRHGDVL